MSNKFLLSTYYLPPTTYHLLPTNIPQGLQFTITSSTCGVNV